MHDIELSEEQVMIRDMARDFARGEIAPHAPVSYTHLTLPTICSV